MLRHGPAGLLRRSDRYGLGRLVAPHLWSPDQDESGIVIERRPDVAEEIVTQTLKQIWTDALGTGWGQLGQPGGQGIAHTARVLRLGHAICVEE